MSDLILPSASVAFACVISLLVLASHPRELQSWLFFAGMVALGVLVALDALSLRTQDFDAFIRLHGAAGVARSVAVGLWFAFSLRYARGIETPRSQKWTAVHAGIAVLPFGLSFLAAATPKITAATDHASAIVSYGAAGVSANVALVIATVLVLMNVEATFRASVGTTRWRVKFVALGVAIVFGAQLYSRSQALLFSSKAVNLAAVEASAFLLGSLLFAFAWFRGGFGALQVYPPQSSMVHSATLFVVGGYLFIVGILAQFISFFGDATNFQTQAFLILIGIVCIGVLLLSDRLRLRVQHAFRHYFGRSYYDFRKVWTLSSERLSNQVDPSSLCTAAARLIAETFNTLSVRVWLLDESRERLTLGASTAPSADEPTLAALRITAADLKALHPNDAAFNLEVARGPLADALRHASTAQFRHGGDRLAVPLSGNGRILGLAVLTDRVNGIAYSPEEADLLRCVGAQLSAALLTQRVSAELMQAKELEAFQTMSAFFVHDLKNTVSTLNLMLQNLPIHFDNPEFRKDALRGIGNTVERVNHLIARLSALRRKVELHPVQTSLPELVRKTLTQLHGLPGVTLTADFAEVSSVFVDPEHFSSVISNLLLNARDATVQNPEIHVQVREAAGRVSVSVRDNGCGMTREFITSSLFRPFNSTKSKGLGIGMFQCKVLVEAHRGTLEVDSTPGKGTTVTVFLPAGS